MIELYILPVAFALIITPIIIYFSVRKVLTKRSLKGHFSRGIRVAFGIDRSGLDWTYNIAVGNVYGSEMFPDKPIKDFEIYR